MLQLHSLSKRRLFLGATSTLAAITAPALAEVDVTLGGELGMGAEVGLSKTDMPLTVFNTASLNLNIVNSTDYGLIIGGNISLKTLNELELNAYEVTDPNGVQEHRMFRATNEGPSDLEARAYAVSGGAGIAASNVVAVKINSDWISPGGTITKHLLNIPPRHAENICKLAGTFADSMRGRSAPGESVPLNPLAGLETRVGNGVKQSDVIFINGAGATGHYLPRGQFAAKRSVWAAGPIVGTQTVSAAPATVGARVSINGGSAAVVFETRFPSTKVTPGMVEGGLFPQRVLVQEQEQSATVLFSPGPDELTGPKVNNAKVFLGPFMELETVQGSEKLVVGALCLTEDPFAKETGYYMQPKSKMLSVSDAAIFIEGGFGTLQLSNHDQSGMIASTGPVEDRASLLSDSHLVVSADAFMFGVSGMAAVVNTPNSSNFDTLLGAKINMEGVSFAADLLFEEGIFGGPDGWQLEAGIFPIPAASFSVALDHDSAWWMEASAGSGGFSASAFAGVDSTSHPNAPIYWSLTGAVRVNDAKLSVETDQLGDLGFDFRQDTGWGELYANVKQSNGDVVLGFGSNVSF